MKSYFILLILFCCGQRVSFAQHKQLQQFITGYATKNQFNGTILVQKGTKTIYHQNFGIAERRFNIPISMHTNFKVASITKMFTAVLILQLFEAGKIDLNQHFNTYLPDYHGEAGFKVSVHQLLNHTSGMRNIDTVRKLENALKYGLGFYQKPYTSDQIIANFCSDSLVNIPGEKYDYSNSDYIILGKIIEACYQKTYEEVLNEKILKPLGMVGSGLLSDQKIIKNLASTYMTAPDDHHLIPDLPVYIENWYAAGAMYSNTRDLIKFSNSLFGLKLIAQKTLNLMMNPGLDDYGYSVWMRDITGEHKQYKRLERYGGIMGANAVLMHFLDKNITVIILSNTNSTDLGSYALNIGKIII